MDVIISNCPYVFHDGDELVEFLQNSGKFCHLFNGQRVYVNGKYVLTIHVKFWLDPIRVYVDFYR